MAESQDVGSPLNSEPPLEWTPKSAYAVRLTVDQDGAGNTIFTYSEPLFDSGSPLDLSVTEDCMILLQCDESKGLSWSLATDAISLKDSGNAHFYFALRYVDRGIAYVRGAFPHGRKCTQICFGAQLNVAQPDNDRHAFNMDIELEREGRLIPIHIDPDIQNPKV